MVWNPITPGSLLVCGCIYSVIVMLFKDFEAVAKADVTLYTGKVSMELISFLVLRWREPELHRPFRIPGGWPIAILLPLLPVLCVCANIYFQVANDGFWPVLGIPLCMMSTGPLLYPLIVRYRARHPMTERPAVDEPTDAPPA